MAKTNLSKKKLRVHISCMFIVSLVFSLFTYLVLKNKEPIDFAEAFGYALLPFALGAIALMRQGVKKGWTFLAVFLFILSFGYIGG